MVDDAPQPADRRDNHIFLAAIDGLRDDVREDIGHLRDDVREDLAASEGRLTGMVTDFVVAHGAEHAERTDKVDAVHATFEAYIRNAELAQARRDGALGVMRWTVELISKHAPKLVALIVALAGAIGVATGNVSVTVGQ